MLQAKLTIQLPLITKSWNAYPWHGYSIQTAVIFTSTIQASCSKTLTQAFIV